MDGLGNINWWGFSPSIDLLALHAKHINSESDHQAKEVNILLVNAGDARHLLHSIAMRKKKHATTTTRPIVYRFYVYEKMLELYARDALLLSLAVEHPQVRGIQEKTELYLEIYANLLVRDSTLGYIRAKADAFVKSITDLEHLARVGLGLFDFTRLKYKERDFLEAIFKFWRLKPPTPDATTSLFPASKCWELRLRSYLGTRYDARSNCFDWDFAMKLSERPHCSIVNNRLYARWRETGVAYELRDASYDQANCTLSSGMVFADPRSGDKASRRGYFGDTLVGPFLAHGVDTDRLEYYKKQNEHHKYTSLDVAKHNVSAMMQSLLESVGMSDSTAAPTSDDDKKIVEITDEDEKEEAAKKEKEERTSDYVTLDDCQVIFLPLTAFQDMASKSKYDNHFDMVYFSNSGVAHMAHEGVLRRILRHDADALVVVETAKHMIELKNEQIEGFSTRVRQMAAENQLVDLTPPPPQQPQQQPQLSLNTNDEENKPKTVPLETLNFLLFRHTNRNASSH